MEGVVFVWFFDYGYFLSIRLHCIQHYEKTNGDVEMEPSFMQAMLPIVVNTKSKICSFFVGFNRKQEF